MTEMAVKQIGDSMAVEIVGLDLAKASDEDLRFVADVYARNSVVLLRGQKMDSDRYVKLGQALGELVPHTRLEYTVPDCPEIYVLSNKKRDGKMIGVHFDGLGWHSDGTYLKRPLAATLLYSLDVPAEGGDTLFADTCGAYEDLPPELRGRVDDMTVVYDFIYYMETRFPDYVITDRQRVENTEVEHPLVVSRQSDGRRGLYMSNGSSRGIRGMSDEDGRAFLQELTQFVTSPQYVYRHKWEVGDVVIWNNLQTMHTATLYDDTRYERLLHRLWVKAPEGSV